MPVKKNNMPTKPVVSVLMLTADHHAPFIREAIQSVIGQTFKDWELIVLDDGPEYKARQEVEACQDFRVLYISQKHQGPECIADSYNKLLQLARGDFIAVLEGDDLWTDHKLPEQIKMLSEESDSVLCYGKASSVDRYGRLISEKPSKTLEIALREHPDWLYNRPAGAALEGMLHGIFISTLTVLIRKSVLIKIGGFQKIPGGITTVDYPTVFVLALEGAFLFVPYTLGYWRSYGANTSVAHGCKMTLTMIDDLLTRLPAYRHLVKTADLGKAVMVWDNSLAMFYTLLGRIFLSGGDFHRAKFWFSKLFFSRRLRDRIRANLFLGASLFRLRKFIETIYKITGRITIDRLPAGELDEQRVLRVEGMLRRIQKDLSRQEDA